MGCGSETKSVSGSKIVQICRGGKKHREIQLQGLMTSLMCFETTFITAREELLFKEHVRKLTEHMELVGKRFSLYSRASSTLLHTLTVYTLWALFN